MLRRCVISVLLIACAGTPARGDSWTPELQFTTKRVASPRLSPSGGKIVFEVSTADLEKDSWESGLFLVDAAGTGAAQPLENCSSCSHPRWGQDDSTLYMLAGHSGARRIHQADITTGMHTAITSSDLSVGWFEVSPDGESLAYSTWVTKEQSSGWALRILSLDSGQVLDCDIQGSVAGFSWSGDGTRIVSAVQAEGGLDWRSKYLVLIDANSGDSRKLDHGEGAAWMPQVSTDGQRVAYVASPGPATWMRDAELRVLNLDTGAIRTLAATPDRNVDLVAWSPGGEALIGAEYQGSTRRLVEVPVDGSLVRYLGPEDRSMRQPHLRGEALVFVSERWNEPPEVHRATWPYDEIAPMSQVQPKIDAPLGETRVVRWLAEDGETVEGLLTLPVEYRTGHSMPVLVRIHGGPPFPASDGFLGGTKFTAYPLAALAAAGFAILQPNYRGSTGYGREFRHALHADWGGADYDDLMSGVDELVRLGIADPSRLGVMGWSYGGYLTAWCVTQTHRFAAASIGAGMTDLPAFGSKSSLTGMLYDWFGESSESSLHLRRERSPLTHAAHVRCPVLLQHGKQDRRVPLHHAEAFAEAVQAAGGVATLHTYDGGHGPRSPQAELAVLRGNLEWFTENLLVRARSRAAD